MPLDNKVQKVIQADLERMAKALKDYDEIFRESGDGEQVGLAEDYIWPAYRATDLAADMVRLAESS